MKDRAKRPVAVSKEQRSDLTVLGIDPGKSAGFACLFNHELQEMFPLEYERNDVMQHIGHIIKACKRYGFGNIDMVFIENLNLWPGEDYVPHKEKMIRSQDRYACYCLAWGLPIWEVRPIVWQSDYGLVQKKAKWQEEQQEIEYVIDKPGKKALHLKEANRYADGLNEKNVDAYLIARWGLSWLIDKHPKDARLFS